MTSDGFEVIATKVVGIVDDGPKPLPKADGADGSGVVAKTGDTSHVALWLALLAASAAAVTLRGVICARRRKAPRKR